MNPDATLSELLQSRHAELPLYLISMSNTDQFAGVSTPVGSELFRQHLLYWWKLEESGNLLGAGPVDVGTARQEGFAVLTASSLEHACELAYAEPFHQAGWRKNTVRCWQLNEGLVVAKTRELLRL
jgi:uncharacterized protein YciI